MHLACFSTTLLIVFHLIYTSEGFLKCNLRCSIKIVSNLNSVSDSRKDLGLSGISCEDDVNSFSFIEKIMFKLFSNSVADEMGLIEAPQTYFDLISLISNMTQSRPSHVVHDNGKNILVKLFPAWLLKQYKWMFARLIYRLAVFNHLTNSFNRFW